MMKTTVFLGVTLFFLLLGFNLTANSTPLAISGSRSLLSLEGLPDGARIEMTSRSDAKGSVKISGQVVDASGIPIIGAAVWIKGTTNGTSTDTNGQFQLSVTAMASVTLEVSFLGFRFYSRTFELKVDIKITIVLEEDIARYRNRYMLMKLIGYK